MKPPIEILFNSFLIESAKQDRDIEYCLLQSTVEPTIRFKFGSWLNKNMGDRISLNLMEANRIDLVVGIDNHVYFIEFGHLLNLLQHGACLNNGKVNADKNKIHEKVSKLKDKIEGINNNYFNGKDQIIAICSLFSEIKVCDTNNQFETAAQIDRLNSGTLFKYGKHFSYKNKKEYFDNYKSYLNGVYKKNEKVFATGYTEVPIRPGELSLHFKFDYF